MTNFFKGISTLEELKRAYKKLALIHHPDRGGDSETMKALNNEYETAFEFLKNQYNSSRPAEQHIKECPEEFMEVILPIIDIEGIEVEIIGSWVWVSGETKSIKETLKELGYKWAPKKLMWYWYSPEEGRTRSKGKTDINEIRAKYGSDKVVKPTLLK